jgi:predicted N-acyltransferase
VSSANYRIRAVDDLGAIDASHWDALVERDGGGNPFLRHAYLHALEASGSVGPDSGWTPQHLTLWRAGAHNGARDEQLVGAVPGYAKEHSYGEYVFDWSWAEAYQRYGLRYYPKWLVAVPFTPVPGSRLIAADAAARAELTAALVVAARRSQQSSLHVLYAPPEQIALLHAEGLLVRKGVQFHWRNRQPQPYADFDEFLAALTQSKRKKIRAERRQVREAGVTLERIPGAAISASDWSFFYLCYRSTYAAHFSTPYLNLEFFTRLGRSMPDNVVLVLARRGAKRIAASLGIVDDATQPQPRLYGRYWGAVEDVRCLHFECCYYQMIECAIERRLAYFEGGAQGAHKLARGLDPVETYSAHWLAQPQMHAAVAEFLQRETASLEHAVDELGEHRAFRKTQTDRP